MLDERRQESPLAARRHVGDGGLCKRRLPWFGNGTTFDLVSLFVEEPFGDFTPASASALLTTDSEVCAADIVVRRFSRAWRPEVERHGKPCSVR